MTIGDTAKVVAKSMYQGREFEVRNVRDIGVTLYVDGLPMLFQPKELEKVD